MANLQIIFLLATLATSIQGRPFELLDGLSEERGHAWENSGEFEGDIMLKPDDSARNGLISDERRWPNRTLVYKIDEFFDKPYRLAIEEAINEFNTKTCIKMRPKEKGDEDYVLITGEDAEGCSSFVGRHGGKQILKLKPKRPGKGCFRKGTILHELLHALGFYHQQSAPERDNFVKINWANIKPGRENNFQKYGNDTVTNYGVTYDYKSVMHYSAYAFSKNEEKTIEPLVSPKLWELQGLLLQELTFKTLKKKKYVQEEDADIGQREDMTEKDIQKLHNMYKCEQKIAAVEIWDKEKNYEKDIDELETLYVGRIKLF